MIRIKYLKQKTLGMVWVVLWLYGLIVLDLKNLVMLTICTIMFGLPLLISKDRLFSHEYTLEIDILKLIGKRS